MTIQRAVLLDGLKALYLSHHNTARLLQRTDYAAGYTEGAIDMLDTIAQLTGVSSELRELKQKYEPVIIKQ